MFTDLAPLDSARTLAPQLSARAREGERLRTLPADLVDALRTAGLLNLTTPRALGGRELSPLRAIEVIEELSRADGSAGWLTLVGNSTTFLAWLDPAVAADVVADRLPLMTRYAKVQLDFFRDLAWHGTIRHAHDWLALSMLSEDGRAGVEGFLNRKKD